MQFCSKFCIIFMRLPATTPSIFLFSVLKTVNKNDDARTAFFSNYLRYDVKRLPKYTTKYTFLCNFAPIFASFSCDCQPLLLVSFYFRSKRHLFLHLFVHVFCNAFLHCIFQQLREITFVTMPNNYQKIPKNVRFYAILLQFFAFLL